MPDETICWGQKHNPHPPAGMSATSRREEMVEGELLDVVVMLCPTCNETAELYLKDRPRPEPRRGANPFTMRGH